MKSKVKQLAREAGFCFWGDEPHRPKDAVIDWSCNYDKEFEKFVELLVKDVQDDMVGADVYPRTMTSFLEVTELQENTDGSTDFSFALGDYEKSAFLRLGIVTALKMGLEEAKAYEPNTESE